MPRETMRDPYRMGRAVARSRESRAGHGGRRRAAVIGGSGPVPRRVSENLAEFARRGVVGCIERGCASSNARYFLSNDLRSAMRSSSFGLLLGLSLFVLPLAARADAAADPQVARLLEAKKTLNWNRTLGGGTDRYGHAEALVDASAD